MPPFRRRPVRSGPAGDVAPAEPPLAQALSRSLRRRYRLGLIPLVLSALLPVDLYAQSVAGRVVDSVTGDAVEQALVRAVARPDTTAEDSPVRPGQRAGRREIRTTAISDSLGLFSLVLEEGSYSFRIEHISYQTLVTQEIEIGREELLNVEIRLGPLPFEMEPLLVQARGRDPWRTTPFQRRMEQVGAAGRGRFITREDIERAAAPTVNDLLGRQPGLRLVPIRGSTVVIMTGRGQNCRPTLYFDGVPLARGGGDVDLSAWFHPDMIEGIEIYPSAAAAPADMRGDGCGVISIWSRHDAGDGAPLTLRRILIATGILGMILLLGIL